MLLGELQIFVIYPIYTYTFVLSFDFRNIYYIIIIIIYYCKHFIPKTSIATCKKLGSNVSYTVVVRRTLSISLRYIVI